MKTLAQSRKNYNKKNQELENQVFKTARAKTLKLRWLFIVDVAFFIHDFYVYYYEAVFNIANHKSKTAVHVFYHHHHHHHKYITYINKNSYCDHHWYHKQSHCWAPFAKWTKHRIDWDCANCITYSRNCYQWLTLESCFTNINFS